MYTAIDVLISHDLLMVLYPYKAKGVLTKSIEVIYLVRSIAVIRKSTIKFPYGTLNIRQ